MVLGKDFRNTNPVGDAFQMSEFNILKKEGP